MHGVPCSRFVYGNFDQGMTAHQGQVQKKTQQQENSDMLGIWCIND